MRKSAIHYSPLANLQQYLENRRNLEEQIQDQRRHYLASELEWKEARYLTLKAETWLAQALK